MSITFDNEFLFTSGPARIHVGGRSLRHATEHALGARGVQLFSQGVEGRPITQTGVLIADASEQLQQQVDAIEAKLDGVPRLLVDHLDRTWPNVVMVKFEPAAFTRLGPRWKTDYRIEYLQTRA
ncbi:MAG: hypothetical protein ACODAQ_04315 [Phycisphaeraceae bacterium]